MNASDLATLSRAFGEIAFAPSKEWLDAYLVAVQRLLPTFQPNELSDLAWGLLRMGVEPGPEWADSFLQVEVVLGCKRLEFACLNRLIDFNV